MKLNEFVFGNGIFMKDIILKFQLFFNSFFVNIIFLLVLFCMFGRELLADLSMTVAVDRAVIYKGERFMYQIVITDSNQIDASIAPDLSGYNDFEIRVLSRQVSDNSSSASFQVIINGKVVRNGSSTQSRAVFVYELTPKREGNLLIPAPVVFLKGKKILPTSVLVTDKSGKGNADGSIPVTVKLPDEQDIVKMRVETDLNRLYPFQPFYVTLVVQVKSLPAGVLSADASPIAVLREPPNITIDWANDNALPKGLRPTQSLNDWLSSIRAPRSQRGFAINEYATRGLGFDDDFFGSAGGMGDFMSDMMRGRILHFAPAPIKVTRKDANGVNATYWEYRFIRKFMSNEIGEFKFGAAIKGNFVVEDRTSRDGASLQRIYAIAPEVLVNVVDVPVANRPASYIGAFGKFDLKTDIQPRKAKRGEPMTLTLKLIGEGSTGNVKPPDLTANKEITANFKTHSPTEEGDDHSCTFTYPIRATQSGNIIFPSIPITYFDVKNESFVTLQSEAIELDISDSEQLNNGFIFGNNNSSSINFERSERGLIANMTERNVVNQAVDFLGWVLFLVGLLLVYLIFWLFLFFLRRFDSDPRRRRRSGALSRAKSSLNRVQQKLKTNNSSDAIILYGSELQNLLFGYIADLSCVSEQGMTTKDACTKYKELGGEHELSMKLNTVLEMLDGAKYGGLDLKSLDDLIVSIEDILAHPINLKK
ncbi:MAG: BatD family protein [Planctomycetaceae bacterium]|jgi:hypothetical protein|nr:BatD family protein [Planctomycetaceae bacterium]